MSVKCISQNLHMVLTVLLQLINFIVRDSVDLDIVYLLTGCVESFTSRGESDSYPFTLSQISLPGYRIRTNKQDYEEGSLEYEFESDSPLLNRFKIKSTGLWVTSIFCHEKIFRFFH